MAHRRRKKHVEQPDHPRIEQNEIENPFEDVQAFLEQNDPEKALEALEKVPRHLQREGYFFYLRGIALDIAGDIDSAVSDFEMAARKSPNVAPIYLNLAIAYAQLEFWQHAGQAAEKFLKRSPANSEGEELARQILTEAKFVMEDKAKLAGLPLEKFQRANYPNENAQLLLAQGEIQRAIKETEYATRYAPDWSAPRNNRALYLFFLGRPAQATAEEVNVLEKIDAGNIQALGNLILFHTCLWQRDQAEVYGKQLKDRLRASSLEDLDLEKAIEGLGILEDDQALWELAGRLSDMAPESLGGLSWYVLGAAAANTGHVPEAKQLLERAKAQAPAHEAWIDPALRAVKKAARSKTPPVGPCLNGRFPYMHFRQFWPGHIAKELLEGLSNHADEEAIDRQLKTYTARYPFVAYAGSRMLWCEEEEQSRGFGRSILAASGHPGAFEELRRFATSQYGGDQERLQALTQLREKGQLAPNERVRFWSAKDGEWTEIQIRLNRIEDEYFPPCSPQALKLVDQANQAHAIDRGNPANVAKAVEFLRKAIEVDPDCAIALHNLGAMLMLQEKRDEGEVFMQRAVEADPGYLFGYTSLAEVELDRENLETCKDYLDRVFSATSIPANAMLRALSIQARLALVQDELENAKSSLEMMRSLNPDYPEIETLEEQMHLLEISQSWEKRWLESVHRNRNRQLDKPITADEGLTACLERISREALVGALRFWDASTAGRKAEVIARLVDLMLDREYLRWVLSEALREDEKKALAWVLENGGVRTWEEFTGRYGDDFDESPYWQYHEAETVPGRLRMAGLLAVGKVDGRRVAIVPYELRPLLSDILKPITNKNE